MLIGVRTEYCIKFKQKMNELLKVTNKNLIVNEPKSELSKRSLYSKKRKKKNL